MVLEEEAGLSEPRSSMDTNHCRTGPCVGKRAMPTVEVECVGDGGSILGGGTATQVHRSASPTATGRTSGERPSATCSGVSFALTSGATPAIAHHAE